MEDKEKKEVKKTKENSKFEFKKFKEKFLKKEKNEELKKEAKKQKVKKSKISTAMKFEILAIICIILFCVSLAPVTLQNDTYYTIKIGEYITQHGIDMQDHFSWHNLPYTYPHWAYDVFIYTIFAAFGMVGVYVSTCVLSCILGISLYKVNEKLVKNKLISFIIAMASMYVISGYIAARAQLVTFILFVWTIYFIEKFLETKKKRYAATLIIIPIIIANVHCAVWPFYFVLFLPAIGEYVIAWLADSILYKKFSIKYTTKKILKMTKKGKDENKINKLKEKLQDAMIKVEKIKMKRAENKNKNHKLQIVKNDNVKWLILIMVICLFTGLLTPLGTTPYTYLIKTMQGNTTQNISEHLPMTLINHTPILCSLVILLAIMIFTDTKIRLKDLFMIGGLTYLMFLSRRQCTMFVLMGSIILNRMITYLLNKYDQNGISDFTKFVVTKIGAFLMIGTVLVLSLYFVKPKLDDPYINSKTYPVEASNYILENLDVENIKLYNDYNYGSYLIFRGIPVFIDSRADLYAPEFNTTTGNKKDGQDIFIDFINTSSLSTYYGDIFKKYDITHVMTTKNSKLNLMITKTKDNENYIQIYADDNFVIYKIVDAD